jgi:uncharacterized delta-60 repeat protein
MPRNRAQNTIVALALAAACGGAASEASAQAVNWRRAALRVNTDGTKDTTFNDVAANGGPGQLIQTAPNATGTGFFDLGFFGSRILLAGYRDSSFLVQRLSSNGRPDTAYGPNANGIVTSAFPGAALSHAYAIAVDPLGGVVAAGTVLTDGVFKGGIARLLPNGTLNPDFNADGWVVDPLQIPVHRFATAVKITGDNILVAYYTTSGLILVTRYTNTGDIDPTFGDAGLALVTGPNEIGSAIVNDMAIDGNNRILIGGTGLIAGQNVFACWRLTSSGQRDNNFSGDSFAYFWPGKTAQALSVAADGNKVVLAGEAGGAGNRTVGILRLTSTGIGDSTFDGDGYKEHNIPESTEESAWEVAIATGNEPVVTGFSGDRIFASRYSNTGVTEFTRRISVASNTTVEGMTALGIDGNGKFVVAGWIGPPM